MNALISFVLKVIASIALPPAEAKKCTMISPQQQANSNKTMGSVDYDYFVETISIKMGNVNPLVTISMADQEVFQTSLEKFVKEHSSKFSNLEAKFICQMREKMRNDKKVTTKGNNDNNVLIILK